MVVGNDTAATAHRSLRTAMGIIEFNLDGSILDSSQNFLNLVDYSLAELKGKHHRLFCKPTLTNSSEYQDFWRRLKTGTHFTGSHPINMGCWTAYASDV